MAHLHGPHHMCCWSSPNRALHLRELGSGERGATPLVSTVGEMYIQQVTFNRVEFEVLSVIRKK